MQPETPGDVEVVRCYTKVAWVTMLRTRGGACPRVEHG